MMNLQNEQEISNERQEKIEQAADLESTAKMYMRTIVHNDDQLIINISKEFSLFPKVPPRLQNSEMLKDYFDPKIVSFGPYHHRKVELQAAQMIKTKVMRSFILANGKTIEDLYIKVRLLNKDARDSYVDGSTDAYGDEEFAPMMLQDGCLILFLIEWETLTSQKYTINNPDQMFMYSEILLIIAKQLGPLEHKYLYRDMFLLENQIPFIVLKDLMSNIYNENKGLTMIKSYLYTMNWGNFQKQDTQDKDEEEPVHLLGLLKTLISKCRNHHEEKPENKDKDVTRYLQSSGSFSDLQAKGINLKPGNSRSLLSALLKEKPKSICLRDVDFRSGFLTGELKLPPLFVGDDFQVYYTNLIAFEMCDIPYDFTVISYFNFMNSLIDNPEDVKTLRSKRIIFHSLNTDKEMFKWLKELSSLDLSTPNWLPNFFIHQGVREKIERHYNNKIKIWIADIRHEYFSHPWSAISLLAAVVVLILAFLQTFFTIYPRKA